MRNKFDKQLSKLNEELIHMGSMMEQSIEMAISALVKQDREKAEKTMLYADEIERKEKEIENMCFQILLSQQPVAGDLRRVSSAMKMVTDMKRIGDQAGDIAEISIHLADEEYIKKLDHLPQMAKETTVMVIKMCIRDRRKTSCITREILPRSWSKVRSRISTPSRRMTPSVAS